MNKKELVAMCKDIVVNKLQNVQKAIDGYKSDLLSETKSSAGDKHETGRAMLQLEMEKLGQQYQNILTQKQLLTKINVDFSGGIIKVGSVVKLNGYHYFLATSVGQVAFNNLTIMVVSISSPIGKLLIGKQKGDFVMLNNTSMLIEDVF